MVQINYKSDFKITESSETIVSNVPFIFTYYVTKKKKYVASFDGVSEYVNCERLKDGSIEVLFNKSNLGRGTLRVERKYCITDEDFKDGIFNVVTDEATDVFLHDGKTYDPNVRTTVVPPYIKGDKGDPMTWSTMTDEERTELVQSVAEAIDPEMVMTENEQIRQSNEQVREANERTRKASELLREETFQGLEGEMQSAITAGNTAAGNAQKVVDEYDTKVAEQDSKLSQLGSEVSHLNQATEIKTEVQTISENTDVSGLLRIPAYIKAGDIFKIKYSNATTGVTKFETLGVGELDGIAENIVPKNTLANSNSGDFDYVATVDATYIKIYIMGAACDIAVEKYVSSMPISQRLNECIEDIIQVEESIQKIDTAVFLDYSQYAINGKTINNGGEIGGVVDISNTATEQGWNCVVSEVAEGDIFYISGTGGKSTKLWALLDKEYRIVESSAASAKGSFTLTAKVEGYIVCNFFGEYTMYAPKSEELRRSINKLQNEGFTDITELSTINYIYNTNISVGSLLNLSKASYENGSSVIVYPCKEGDRFIITGKGGGSSLLWAFIDNDNILVSKSAKSASEINRMLISPCDGAIVCNFIGEHTLLKKLNEKEYEVKNNRLFFAPLKSSTIKIRFKTSTSLYRVGDLKTLIDSNSLHGKRFKVKSLQEDSFFVDKCYTDVNVSFGDSNSTTIPLRLNNYGQDLFSIRLKYPIVEVEPDGNTLISEYCPSEWEGSYLRKTDDVFSIYKGNGSIFKSFNVSSLSSDELFELLQNDSDILSLFELKRYSGKGVMMSNVNNFKKVYLNKEIAEILYKQGSDVATPTGKVYYDAYPCIIKSNDFGFEHTLTISYKMNGTAITEETFSLDGLYAKLTKSHDSKFWQVSIPDDIISEVLSVEIFDYKKIDNPLLSLQHTVVVGDSESEMNMHTTTKRMHDILSYLSSKGAVSVNLEEYKNILTGKYKNLNKIFCLTFDDFQKSLWTNEEIRNLLFKFDVKPSMYYIINSEDLGLETPPEYAPSTLEFEQMRNSGWYVGSHGFCMYTDRLSYAQFVYGFNRYVEAFLKWYKQKVDSYNSHGAEILDFQYALLKTMGFNTITSGTAPLGFTCCVPTNIDVQYKRITYLDSMQNWDAVKSNLDKWLSDYSGN